MKVLTVFQNHLSTMLLLLVIGLQIMLLSESTSRISEPDASKLDARLAEIQQQLNILVSQQTYITTPGGVAVSVSRQDIEQAVAIVVKEVLPGMLAGKADASAQPANQASYVEVPLSPQQEQTRFHSQETVNQIVDNAILMRHWTKQDTQDLLPHMGNLSTSQRNDLIKKFTDAISHNRLQLDAPPPPL